MEQDSFTIPSARLEGSASALRQLKGGDLTDYLGEGTESSRGAATAFIVGLVSTGIASAIFFATRTAAEEPSEVDESTIMDGLREKWPTLFAGNK